MAALCARSACAASPMQSVMGERINNLRRFGVGLKNEKKNRGAAPRFSTSATTQMRTLRPAPIGERRDASEPEGLRDRRGI